jgi:hypothetical protein
MSEEFLQYIWKNSLFEQKEYISSSGEKIIIEHVGEQNLDSGPDFNDTRIRINGTLWAGNCEVHQVASDWLKHDHNSNKAYDNVVLHVVLKNDATIMTTAGRNIPAIEIIYQNELEENYKLLQSSRSWIPCADKIKKVDRFYIVQWLTKLSIERLENRSLEINRNLEHSKNHWEEAFYQYLARSFGFKVNAVPFEMLAQSVPLNILAKHKDNLKQLEAILFGQSGLLNEPNDGYSQELSKEYLFLQRKYSLKPIEKHLWKFMRLRPANFPTVRIAQFASLVHRSLGLFSKILEAENIEMLEKYFDVTASQYWDNHFRFGQISKGKPKHLSTGTIQLLLVNSVLPFIFVYGKSKNLPEYKDKAIEFLEKLKPENNSIVKGWHDIGIEVANAFETQALLQLKNEYCQHKNCLKCDIGNRMISKNAGL